MYSSIASLYIALDSRLQQANSNRKQSIHPEQYDMAINDAILQLIKSRISALLNSKQESFEQTIGRYSDLESLKRQKNVLIYNDNSNILNNSNYKFELPSDCFRPIILKGDILYNKNNLTYVQDTNIIKNISIIKLTDESISEGTISLYKSNPNSQINIPISNITKSNTSLFYSLNYIKSVLQNDFNIESFIENYDGKYYPNSIICVSKYNTNVIDSGDNCEVINITSNIIIKNIQEFDENNIPKYVIYRNRPIELVSSKNFSSIESDNYTNKNIHLNPVYRIVNNLGTIIGNPKFKINNGLLEYIKYPRLVNGKLNIMTDLDITDEILDIATTNLSGILKDSAYQINKQKEQFNN